MPMAWHNDSLPTTITRLTVRASHETAALGVVALRLRAERCLSKVDLRPASLPPGALFVVRHLRTVTPLSGQASSSPWAEALHQRMADLCHTAARPAHGSVPTSAQSVLFADMGDLLGCLTRDILARQAWERWYWESLLRHAPRWPGEALAYLWQMHAAWVPTALVSLPLATAYDAVALFSPSEVTAVTRALASAFELASATWEQPWLAAGVVENLSQLVSAERNLPAPGEPERSAGARVDGAFPPEPAVAAASSLLPAHHTEEQPLSVISDPPPWQRWLPWSDPQNSTQQSSPQSQRSLPLAPPAQALLGLAFTLYHAPAFARSAHFARQTSAWLTAVESGRKASARAEMPAVPLTQSPHLQRNMQPSEGDSHSTPPAPAAHHHQPSSPPPAPRSLFLTQSLHPQRNASNGQPSTEDSHNTPTAPAAHHHQPSALPDPRPPIPTALGGLFYLINLLTWLDLPAAGAWAEPPRSLAEHVGAWGLVEALGRVLLGQTQARYMDDPLWGELAVLDGRTPGTPIGATLPPCAIFRLPAAWLRRTRSATGADPSAAHWWIATQTPEDRLMLSDAATGVLVVDAPCAGRSLTTLATAEVAKYATQGITADWRAGEASLPGALELETTTAVGESLAWWLRRVRPFLQWRLLRTLGEPVDDTERLVEGLLLRRGHLFVGRTHVDVTLSLEESTIAVRRAGLDCDPGWVPDLGRIVLFHYE